MDQSTLGSSGGRPSKTGGGILVLDVIRVFATKHDPDSVADKPLYMNRNRFDGVWSSGSVNGSRAWHKDKGVPGVWEASASISNAVGGCAPMAAMIVRTGLACRSGNEALVKVGKLGFMASLWMTLGSNGNISVAQNAASIASFVNARKKARPNMPVKSPFVMACLLESSNM